MVADVGRAERVLMILLSGPLRADEIAGSLDARGTRWDPEQRCWIGDGRIASALLGGLRRSGLAIERRTGWCLTTAGRRRAFKIASRSNDLNR
jgi:hypothetical protein